MWISYPAALGCGRRNSAVTVRAPSGMTTRCAISSSRRTVKSTDFRPPTRNRRSLPGRPPILRAAMRAADLISADSRLKRSAVASTDAYGQGSVVRGAAILMTLFCSGAGPSGSCVHSNQGQGSWKENLPRWSCTGVSVGTSGVSRLNRLASMMSRMMSIVDSPASPSPGSIRGSGGG